VASCFRSIAENGRAIADRCASSAPEKKRAAGGDSGVISAVPPLAQYSRRQFRNRGYRDAGTTAAADRGRAAAS
jgi:hypothetical protein